MNRLLATGVVLLFLVSGCGSSSAPRAAAGGRPTWGDCRTRSGHSIDYAAEAKGEPSALAALASYRTPGDHVVRVPAAEHRRAQWLLVDDAGVIHTSVGLVRGRDGWLVDEVETCGG